MKFVWDELKRQQNIAKHGLDFASLSPEFFRDALVVGSRGGRFKAIDYFQDVAVIVVVFKPLGSEAVSIISMRRANRKERSL